MDLNLLRLTSFQKPRLQSVPIFFKFSPSGPVPPFAFAVLFIPSLNPLSPNIHIQILQTDFYTFPSRISCENLLKDHGSFSLEIILLILIILSLDSVWILLGEN